MYTNKYMAILQNCLWLKANPVILLKKQRQPIE